MVAAPARRRGRRAGRQRLRDRRARPSRRWSPPPGVDAARGRGGARGRRGRRLRPPRLRLRGAADRDAGPARRRALFATSRDPTLPMPGGEWPGPAPILAAVETASGRRRRDRRQARAPPLRARPRARSPADGAGGDGRRPDRLRHRGRPAGRAWTTILVLSGASTREEAEAADAAARPRRRRPRGAAAVSAEPAAPASPARLAFAGIFAVTFCGLLAVGAVLPVLPRYVHGPLGGGNIAVGIVIGSYAITGLLLRPVAGPLRRPPRPQADGPGRLAAGRASPASSTCCRSASPA